VGVQLQGEGECCNIQCSYLLGVTDIIRGGAPSVKRGY